MGQREEKRRLTLLPGAKHWALKVPGLFIVTFDAENLLRMY